MKDRDSNSFIWNTANSSCNFESKQEHDKGASINSTEHTNALTSEENSSTGLSHEVGSFSEKTALAELRFAEKKLMIFNFATREHSLSLSSKS